MSGRSAAHRKVHSDLPRKGAPTSARDGPWCSTDSRTPPTSCSRVTLCRGAILIGSLPPGHRFVRGHPGSSVLGARLRESERLPASSVRVAKPGTLLLSHV